MNWKPALSDPVPALIHEAHSRGAALNKHPCSLCREANKILARDHFHASDLGACPRRVLYSMRSPGEAKSSTSPEFLRDGHLHESSMLINIANGFDTMLEDVHAIFGQAEITVFPAVNEDERIANIDYIERGEVVEVKLVAHFDGLLMFGDDVTTDYKFLLECKAVKPYKFDLIRKGEMDKEWYGQMQTYLRILNLKVGYLLVKNRETSAMLMPIRVERDSNYLNERKRNLIEVHKALRNGASAKIIPTDHEKKTDSECKFCKFQEQCWGEKPIRLASAKRDLEDMVALQEVIEEDSILNFE